MAKKSNWAAFPYAEKSYQFSAATLKKSWDRLHRGDCEPLPKDDGAVEAWIAFHAGDFETAYQAGQEAGGAGLVAACKAACIYANYLEEDDKKKIKLYEEVAGQCEDMQSDAKNVNAFYLHAYALGRYAQGISIVKALKDGVGTKVKESLTTAIKLAPKHADAHIALGTYHAEIIDKVGAMVGGLTYGVKKDTAIEMFEKAIKLNPDSAIARIEYANALVMLQGKAKLKDAEKLYQDAAKVKAMDAMERLDVETAKAELED
jgi:tetratricopeptide (TPR) repeat protein